MILHQPIDDKITQGADFEVEIPGRTMHKNSSGQLFQNFLGTKIVHRVDLAHGLRSRDDFQRVVDAFYVLMLNGYEGCLVRNWRDYIATQSNSRANIIGAGATLQLQRKHNFGGVSIYRDITKPRAAPVPVVYRTRAGVTSAISSTVDTTTGIATITGHAGGDTYTWAGWFDLPMAFSDNKWTGSLEISIDNLHIRSSPIMMEEIL